MMELVDKFLNRVIKTKNCWLWKGEGDSFGYGRMRVNGHQMRTHRLSYELFKGPIPKNLCVCHKCDNPSCVNPEHLWLGTQSDNHRDMVNKNRHFVPNNNFKKGHKLSTGEKNGRSKLTIDKIKEIRTKYIPYKYSTIKLSKEYNVTRECIREIVNNRTWVGI